MSHIDTLTFRCRPSPVTMLLCMVFFGVGVWILAWKAMTNDRGLVISGLIHFSQPGATFFYWALAAVSMLFVITVLWVLISIAIFGCPDVVLTADSISIPAGFPIKRPLTIRYAEITALSKSQINGQRFLLMQTAAKNHHLVLNWLASKEVEQEVESELVRRMRTGVMPGGHAR